MANEEHIALLKKGVESWNQWREENPDAKPDFSKADLRGTKLQNANLSDSNLEEVKFQFSNLKGAILTGSNVNKGKFQDVNLTNVKLNNADLKQANFFEANLQHADMENSNLQGAQFNEDTTLFQTNFKGANLKEASGLMENQIQDCLVNKETKLPEYLGEETDDDFLLQM
jgi:uncharacterized protein YjbI with pentapeptide repeats